MPRTRARVHRNLRHAGGALTAAAYLAVMGVAHAQSAQTGQNAPTGPEQRQSPIPGPAGGPPVPTGPAPGAPGFAAQLFAPERTNVLGDMFRVRPRLGDRGVTFGLQETSEVLGNVTGGIQRGAAYAGVTIVSLGVDTDRAFGLPGGTFNVSALQLHGRNLGAENLFNLQTPSGIVANRATRLWELWYQQTLLAGSADVKIGQQSIDTEFLGSAYAGTFINTVLGWPVVPSYDLYAGGPAFPLSSLGVRARYRPNDATTLLAGVFDDNPPGGPFDDDSALRGAAQSGTKFNLNTGALFVLEAQYAVNQPSDDAAAPPPAGLAATYKIGAWADTADYFDPRKDSLGLSLADPNTSGTARRRSGNFSLYAVADQTIWQPDPKETRSVGVFARFMTAPGDRNLISVGFNAGVVLKGPFAGRDNDSVGLAYGLAQVGRSASRLDKDVGFYSGAAYPVRSSESVIELTYQAQVAPWWTVQPDFQYVFLPGGGVADPNRPGVRIGNEAILGVRTNIVF